jgi:hypothetical protein
MLDPVAGGASKKRGDLALALAPALANHLVVMLQYKQVHTYLCKYVQYQGGGTEDGRGLRHIKSAPPRDVVEQTPWAPFRPRRSRYYYRTGYDLIRITYVCNPHP